MFPGTRSDFFGPISHGKKFDTMAGVQTLQNDKGQPLVVGKTSEGCGEIRSIGQRCQCMLSAIENLEKSGLHFSFGAVSPLVLAFGVGTRNVEKCLIPPFKPPRGSFHTGASRDVIALHGHYGGRGGALLSCGDIEANPGPTMPPRVFVQPVPPLEMQVAVSRVPGYGWMVLPRRNEAGSSNVREYFRCVLEPRRTILGDPENDLQPYFPLGPRPRKAVSIPFKASHFCVWHTTPCLCFRNSVPPGGYWAAKRNEPLIFFDDDSEAEESVGPTRKGKEVSKPFGSSLLFGEETIGGREVVLNRGER